MQIVVKPNIKFKNELIPLKIDKVRFIVVHHIEADNATVEDIHKWHLDNGWAGIGYNEYIRKDGTCYICRGDNIGAQCEGFNSCSYGIAVEGNYNKAGEVPKIQYDALVDRIKVNMTRFPKDCVCVPHHQLCNTECPGIYFPMLKLLTDIVTPTNGFKDALDNLVKAGIVKTSDYWFNTAKKNSTCNGEYVNILIENMARYIKYMTSR